MRLALFGGTFDPVHNGHLEIAAAAAETFNLDRILFIPGGDPPHKSDRARTPYQDRFRMVELACEPDPRFEASRLEDPERLEGRPSYSFDTITRVRETLGPDDELFFLLGEDAFRDLSIWYRLDDVVELVEFLVVSRGGEERTIDPPHPRVRFERLDAIDNPTSSSEIRRLAALGEDISAMTPAPVAEFIAEYGLYTS